MGLKVLASTVHEFLGIITFLQVGEYGYALHSSEYGLVAFDDYELAFNRFNNYVDGDIDGDE